MLDVFIECNMKIVNYLDNLNDGTYKRYKKPNNEMKYIHADSDHPPSIITQIFVIIIKRNISRSCTILRTKPCKLRLQRKINLRRAKCKKPKGNKKNAIETSYGLIHSRVNGKNKYWQVFFPFNKQTLPTRT